MDALLAELIRFLQELQQMGIVLKVLTLASIPSTVALIFGALYFGLTRKVKARHSISRTSFPPGEGRRWPKSVRAGTRQVTGSDPINIPRPALP